MHPGVETVFLRKRHGFVRLALEHGAPLVPVFAFGQTPQYGWVRLPFAARLARKIGWVPMLIWGAMGTPMPRKIPLKIVIGKAIEVPKLGVGNADPGTVERYLKKFIEELEGIYERHKDDQGAVTHGGAVPPLMVY
jgi:diacylglycerol O-acyltransferase 2, plant